MSKMRAKDFSVVLFAGIAVILAAQTSFGKTVAVGNCKSHLVSYSTISAAVAAAAPNSTVLVCPGTYPEQVTITQALNLKGLPDATGAWPVIAVPSGGLGSSGAQLSVPEAGLASIGTVNIANLVVDGTGSGFDCSTGNMLAGIYDANTSGSLENLEVRNQSPGGCGVGIWVEGGPADINTVNIRNSFIHDFDYAGILAGAPGSSAFFVNITSSRVKSSNPSVQTGIGYFFADGTLEYNHIILAGGTGLQLENLYSFMNVRGNAVVGASTGILAGTSEGSEVIVGNVLSNNGTGIAVSGLGEGAVVRSNNILQSSVEAIDLDCSNDSQVVGNTIFGAPIGVSNMNSGDTIKQNIFSSVATQTTACSP